MTESVRLEDKGYLRLPAILKLVPIGRSTWWAGVRTGKYPKSVKLGPNTTAWRAEDIMKLLESFQ